MPKQQIAKPSRGVEMPTRRANPVGRHEHPRARHNTVIDRIAQGDIDELLAPDKPAPQIAHRCKSRLHCHPRKCRRRDRLLGNIQIHLFQTAIVVVPGEIRRQMRMRVHEPWRERRIAEVDHLRALRNREVAPCVHNLVALHDHDAVRHESLRFTVEKPGRLQNNCRGRWVSGLSRCRNDRGEEEEIEEAEESRLLHACEYEIRQEKARCVRAFPMGACLL
jgi:hypothetical protein